MPRVVPIGVQDFEKIITNNYFYIDKTSLIKEWWESGDEVTLITRPRRFGKTLNLNMLNRFWNVKYQGQGGIFEGLDIWKEETYRKLQGTYPVIFLSFADVKEDTYEEVRNQIIQILTDLYSAYYFLRDCGKLNEKDKEYFDRVGRDMCDSDAAKALHRLSDYLYRYYGKKVLIFLDEYDTPMQEAYANGYWKELVSFTRSLFNSSFKTNPYLERAIMTGITRVSRESMFSDLNNLNVITTTSKEYAACFGFTEAEVFTAMDEFGFPNKKEVKKWYDGFTFGNIADIYNPWSIINYLKKKTFSTYWANTSSNSLVGSLLQTGSKNIKMQFEQLLSGKSITCRIDEEIVYNRLGQNEDAVWSLLLAVGYLKLEKKQENQGALALANYEGNQGALILTNYEVKLMFEKMVQDWFAADASDYNDFVKAMLLDDVDAMNEYMNRVSLSVFSSFDTGKKPSREKQPERFYHGFVLGLLVDLAGRYRVTSNRESGFGRYDVILEPLDKKEDGIILEFKVRNPNRESSLEDTVQAALAQIEERKYGQALLELGIKREHIRKYGFAFEGKEVLIGSGL